MRTDGTLSTLENDELLITVIRRRAEFTRIFDKKAGRDVLQDADPTIWDRRASVPFPSVGKCYEGRYIYEEKEHQVLTQHGFAGDIEFGSVLHDLDECWFKLKDTLEIFEKHPFHFRLEIGHRLEGRTITMMWKVTNPDFGRMLFMMGGHPASQMPEGHSIYDYTFEFNREECREGQFQEELRYLAPTNGGYESEESVGTLSLQDGRAELTKGSFDTAPTYMLDDAQVSSISLLLDGRPYVIMGCDDFPCLGAWTMEDTHSFVCLEPWYGIYASEGCKEESEDRKGIIPLSG